MAFFLSCSAKLNWSLVLAGDTVFVHSAAATPKILLDALAKHGKESKLEKVTICHIHIEGPMEHLKPEYQGMKSDLL